MAVNRSFFRRYIFRKDFFAKVRSKLWGMYKSIRRKLTKNAFDDQQRLFEALYPPTVIFDVGAKVGDISYKYRRLFPQAQIYAFEPYQDAAEIFSERFKTSKGVYLIQKAVSDELGGADLYTSEVIGMNSLLEPVNYERWKFDEAQSPTSIETVTLDYFCELNGIEHIDILKMDIQGSEYNALRGAEHLLMQSAISLIYTEWQLVPFYEQQKLAADMTVLLAKYDYTLFNFYAIRESLLGQARWGDAIYLSPVMRQKLEEKYGLRYCGW